jgi:hypothetical protein
LDSASKRASVVSLAKTLGYTPSSATSATAIINMTVNNPNQSPSSLTLPQHSHFSTIINGNNFTFYNPAEVTIIPENGIYSFKDLAIVQGTPLSYKYTVQSGQKYIIPNANSDLTTLKVTVQESSSSDTFTTFIPATSLVDLAYDSNVYFVKEIDGGLYEIIFGDGIISSNLTNGNIVHLDYFVTMGSEANGARSFTYNGSNLIGGSPLITTISVASGGTEIESVDSIKYNAPRNYSAQNRAVTAEDYKVILPTLYPNIESSFFL